MIPRALLDTLPLIIPAIPFGLVLGLAVTPSGIGNLVGWSSSSIVFAGAAQLTLVTLLGGGAVWVAAVGAALVVNLRHAMYSGALAPTSRKQPRWLRWLGDRPVVRPDLRRVDDRGPSRSVASLSEPPSRSSGPSRSRSACWSAPIVRRTRRLPGGRAAPTINLYAIVITGVGTYLTRVAFIVALAEWSLPTRVERGLEYVGLAVLSARW